MESRHADSGNRRAAPPVVVTQGAESGRHDLSQRGDTVNVQLLYEFTHLDPTLHDVIRLRHDMPDVSHHVMT